MIIQFDTACDIEAPLWSLKMEDKLWPRAKRVQAQPMLNLDSTQLGEMGMKMKNGIAN